MDGEEGMELIDQYQPDIILSDIKMPEKDGFRLQNMRRKISRYRNYLVDRI